MTALVTGIYRHGRIDLLEAPPGLREGPVQALLIEQPESRPEPRYLQPGKYGVGNSTPDDFRDAEWHGEEEFDALYGR